jgi:hypothetical protein
VALELAQGSRDGDPLRRHTQAAGAEGVAQSGVGGLLHGANVAQTSRNPDQLVALNEL